MIKATYEDDIHKVAYFLPVHQIRSLDLQSARQRPPRQGIQRLEAGRCRRKARGVPALFDGLWWLFLRSGQDGQHALEGVVLHSVATVPDLARPVPSGLAAGEGRTQQVPDPPREQVADWLMAD